MAKEIAAVLNVLVLQMYIAHTVPKVFNSHSINFKAFVPHLVMCLLKFLSVTNLYCTIPFTVCSHPHCCGSTQYSLDNLPNVTTQQPTAKGGPGGSSEWEVPRSVIDIGAEVGQGSYGVVFKGQLKLTARSLKIYAH